MINTQHMPRRFWRRMNNLGFAFMVAMFSLLFGVESLAVAKSSITVEFKVDDNLLQYTPSKSFKNTLNKYTCNIAKKRWGFLDWCCETGECTQETDKAVWTVKLEAKKSENSALVSWHINHFVNSDEIEPDYFAQNELYNSVAIKPVTSDRKSQIELFLKIKDKIENQFEIEAFRNKATELLVKKAPVAHELMTFKDEYRKDEYRTVLILPFRYCDLSLKEQEASTEPKDFLKFIVNLDFNNRDPNVFVLTRNGVVDSNRSEDKNLIGFIKGKVTTSAISSSNVEPNLPVTDISNTIFSEHINKVKSVYINSYTHDPASVCSVEDSLVIGDPGNSPPQGTQP